MYLDIDRSPQRWNSSAWFTGYTHSSWQTKTWKIYFVSFEEFESEPYKQDAILVQGNLNVSVLVRHKVHANQQQLQMITPKVASADAAIVPTKGVNECQMVLKSFS